MDPSAQKYSQLFEFDHEETVICTIKKHVIGLVPIVFTGMLVSLCFVVSSVFFGSWLEDQREVSLPQYVTSVIHILGIVLALVSIGLTYVAVYIYTHNILIVTNDKVVQILYRNFVDRKVSQLSLGDLQDVTVEQRGILARIIGYGTLIIETAGEQNNFIFSFVPYPYHCAKEIVGAREASIKKYGN